jgi:hypothetical protein
MLLDVEAGWSHLPESSHDYCRNSSLSWVDLWTNQTNRSTQAPKAKNQAKLYEARAFQARHCEDAWLDVRSVQQIILDAMKHGAEVRQSHKEGGTHIRWIANRFVRIDYGDNPDKQAYESDEDFLEALFRFCQFDLQRSAGPKERSPLETWKLILRRLT